MKPFVFTGRYTLGSPCTDPEQANFCQELNQPESCCATHIKKGTGFRVRLTSRLSGTRDIPGLAIYS